MKFDDILKGETGATQQQVSYSMYDLMQSKNCGVLAKSLDSQL